MKHWSSHLNREMEFKVYGHTGRPVLFIPCQSGRFFDFENFKMIDHWAPFIESGRCTVYSCDCLDDVAWAAKGADNRWRIENHERWFHYIVEELVPYIRHLSGERNGFDQGILTFGASMGAMHAANLFFRRPDLFNGVFAISGLYDSLDSFGDYMDDLVYNNSPVNYLANMPQGHPYVDMYNSRRGVICVGQGAWEIPATTYQMSDILKSKGIHTWVDFWGYDCNHDWDWWHKQVAYFVPWLLHQK